MGREGVVTSLARPADIFEAATTGVAPAPSPISLRAPFGPTVAGQAERSIVGRFTEAQSVRSRSIASRHVHGIQRIDLAGR